jgi:signal recognition particle receptor subunit beta
MTIGRHIQRGRAATSGVGRSRRNEPQARNHMWWAIMALIDVANRAIHARIVYYGPGLSGKTTNLVNIHQRLPEDIRGEMKSIATEAERTLFFDFVPIEDVRIGGWSIRFHLYSVPGQDVYVRTRRAILGGADGVVFVADTDPARRQANLDSLAEFEQHLEHYQRTATSLPIVLQYNKVDLPEALSRQAMDAALNAHDWPTYEAIATQGNGVSETLTSISKLVARTL